MPGFLGESRVAMRIECAPERGNINESADLLITAAPQRLAC